MHHGIVLTDAGLFLYTLETSFLQVKEAQPALVGRVQATPNMEGYQRCPSSQALRSRVCLRAMLSGVRKTASAEVMSNLGFPSDTVGLTIGNVPSS